MMENIERMDNEIEDVIATREAPKRVFEPLFREREERLKKIGGEFIGMFSQSVRVSLPRENGSFFIGDFPFSYEGLSNFDKFIERRASLFERQDKERQAAINLKKNREKAQEMGLPSDFSREILEGEDFFDRYWVIDYNGRERPCDFMGETENGVMYLWRQIMPGEIVLHGYNKKESEIVWFEVARFQGKSTKAQQVAVKKKIQEIREKFPEKKIGNDY